MMRDEHNDIVITGRVKIGDPRRVLLLNPFLLLVTLSLAVVSVIFTLWPEALEHSALSFEQRGVIHHIWHYALMIGSFMTLAGLLSPGRIGLKIEFIGLGLMIATLGMHTVAFIADGLSAPTPVNGIGVTLRVSLILAYLVRAFIVATEPSLDVPVADDTQN